MNVEDDNSSAFAGLCHRRFQLARDNLTTDRHSSSLWPLLYRLSSFLLLLWVLEVPHGRSLPKVPTKRMCDQ
jgi:hypothetical protein